MKYGPEEAVQADTDFLFAFLHWSIRSMFLYENVVKSIPMRGHQKDGGRGIAEVFD